MESYEKKYNKAQKWIESIYSELSHEQQMEAVAFFPELRESEDERISKEIIKYLERTVPHHHRDEVLKSKEWIAWLEKQGQKPILDFKAKDWYVSKVDGKIYNAKFMEKTTTNLARKLEIEKAAMSATGIIEREEWFIKGAEWSDKNPSYISSEKQGEQMSDPRYSILDKLIEADDIYQMSVNDAMVEEAKNKAIEALSKLGISKLLGLEKQDEQKPIDKVEPKFKVGDWIVCGKLVTQITSIENDGYTNSDQGFISFETAKKFHLWTIKDAKDGDVLHSTGLYSDCIFIYNGLDNWKFDEPNGNRAVATGYCCLSVSADNMEFGIQGPDCIEVNTVKPATKIQRDLLEKAMTDAGYRWNPDENKIEKIEQKPDWNKEDEKMLYSAIEYVQTYPAHRNSVVNWLKSLKERIGG